MYEEKKDLSKLQRESEEAPTELEDQKDPLREGGESLGEGLLNPARLPGEPFADYKIRQKIMTRAQKTRLRSARRIWDSKKLGPVRIRDHATPKGIEQLTRDKEDEKRSRAITG